MKFRLAFAAAVVAATSLAPALAALPTGKLEFVQRTGTAFANESIPVVIRLTLDPTSSPLTFTSDPITGFLPEDIPTEGRFDIGVPGEDELRPFASVNTALLNTFYSCQGDFTIGCDPSPNYKFEFNTSSSPAHPSINFLTSFTLAPGGSFDFTFGFFVPAAGGAAPGVYRWNGAGVTLGFQGLDDQGNYGNTYENMVISTGNELDPGVAFERTVTAVPEPSTYAMLALGLAAVAGFARRRGAQAR